MACGARVQPRPGSRRGRARALAQAALLVAALAGTASGGTVVRSAEASLHGAWRARADAGGVAARRAWIDARARVRGAGGEAAGRWVDDVPFGFLVWEGGPGRRFLVGDLEAAWGCGCLLEERAFLRGIRVRPTLAGRAQLFRARGTLARTSVPRRGAAGRLALGRLTAAAWRLGSQLGLALGLGSLGLAVGWQNEESRRGCLASLAWHGTAAGGWARLEAVTALTPVRRAAPAPSHRCGAPLGIGAAWAGALPPACGRCQGAVRWSAAGVTEASAAGEAWEGSF